MESFDGGYSRIKQLTPDLIIMFVEMDDVAGCQLLSMLAFDKQLAGIPLVTCPARCRRQKIEDFMAEVNRDLSRRPQVVERN
jgi:CheY-like chemotaxis protein